MVEGLKERLKRWERRDLRKITMNMHGYGAHTGWWRTAGRLHPLPRVGDHGENCD